MNTMKKRICQTLSFLLFCFFLNCLICSCDNKRKKTKSEDAIMKYVKEKTESDGSKWYVYEKNEGKDSLGIAIVDKNGNFLTRIFNNMTYDTNSGSICSKKGFKTSYCFINPETGEKRYGDGFIDQNLSELLYPEFGSRIINQQVDCGFSNTSKLYYNEIYRSVNPFTKGDKETDYKFGCYDKDWNVILMPIYEKICYSYKRDSEYKYDERFCVKYRNRWYSTNLKLDEDGHVTSARSPAKKGFYKYIVRDCPMYLSDHIWESELLYFTDYICMLNNEAHDIPDEQELIMLDFSGYKDGNRIYKFTDRKYYEYDGEDFYFVHDYYDSDNNHVYNRAKLYKVNKDAYDRLNEYEDAYKNYFNEIEKQIKNHGFITNEKLWALQKMIPDVKDSRSNNNAIIDGPGSVYPIQQALSNIDTDCNDIENNSNQQTEMNERKWRDCSHCHGKGTVIRDSHIATYGNDTQKYCSECGRSYFASTGHSHVICPVCHGNKGFWSE